MREHGVEREEGSVSEHDAECGGTAVTEHGDVCEDDSVREAPAAKEGAAVSQTPPWERLEEKARELAELRPCCRGKIHPLAVVDGVLELGEGSVVKAGTVIEGRVRIGRNCIIGPNAYLRGETWVGDDCRIGQAVEVKSSILGNSVAVAHLSYVGDSVLEDDVNVGGGCILSNFRHDAGEIRMPWQGKLVPTGRQKLGAHVGAHSRLGCKCVLLPGRVLPPGSRTEPGSIIR